MRFTTASAEFSKEHETLFRRHTSSDNPFLSKSWGLPTSDRGAVSG